MKPSVSKWCLLLSLSSFPSNKEKEKKWKERKELGFSACVARGARGAFQKRDSTETQETARVFFLSQSKKEKELYFRLAERCVLFESR
jgi:hypothetical protein